MKTGTCRSALRWLAGLCLAALSACQAAVPPSPRAPDIAFADCRLTAPGQTTSVPAQCGQWTVLEDRANPSGRKIKLHVAVVSAVSRSPEADALFFLAGGPGQAASQSYVELAGALDQIRQKRNIVLVDQRGTGQSNALACPNLAGDDQNLDEDLSSAEVQQRLKDCLAALPGDPRFYTTSASVQDLDEVRAALGYDKIDLYGVSYGTRVAQTYLRQYPQHVRAVILDGVVPQTEPLGLNVARDAQRALDLIFDRCAAQADCHQAFPNPRADFQAVLRALDQGPVQVTFAHPVTGQQTQLRLTRAGVALSVRILSYAPETAALLPLLLHTAAQGNYAPLAAQSLLITEELQQTISDGLAASVACSEDAPFITPAAAAAADAGTYYGDLQTASFQTLCAVWPHIAATADFKQPVASTVPVLLLSGEADPVTPPANAAEVAATLSHSLALVAPGQGHNVIFRGCLPRVAADFIKSATVEGLDTACVNDIRPMPFFVDFTGPRP